MDALFPQFTEGFHFMEQGESALSDGGVGMWGDLAGVGGEAFLGALDDGDGFMAAMHGEPSDDPSQVPQHDSQMRADQQQPRPPGGDRTQQTSPRIAPPQQAARKQPATGHHQSMFGEAADPASAFTCDPATEYSLPQNASTRNPNNFSQNQSPADPSSMGSPPADRVAPFGEFQRMPARKAGAAGGSSPTAGNPQGQGPQQSGLKAAQGEAPTTSRLGGVAAVSGNARGGEAAPPHRPATGAQQDTPQQKQQAAAAKGLVGESSSFLQLQRLTADLAECAALVAADDAQLQLDNADHVSFMLDLEKLSMAADNVSKQVLSNALKQELIASEALMALTPARPM